jgi:hypothetical protein
MKGYGLPSDQIIDLAVAPDGTLWAITAGGIGYFGGRGLEELRTGEKHVHAICPASTNSDPHIALDRPPVNDCLWHGGGGR